MKKYMIFLLGLLFAVNQSAAVTPKEVLNGAAIAATAALAYKWVGAHKNLENVRLRCQSIHPKNGIWQTTKEWREMLDTLRKPTNLRRMFCYLTLFSAHIAAGTNDTFLNFLKIFGFKDLNSGKFFKETILPFLGISVLSGFGLYDNDRYQYYNVRPKST